MASFPTTVPTTNELLDAKNNTKTTLDGAINNSVTTIQVADTSNFPTAGRFTFDDGTFEVVSYTSKNATQFLGATRGVDGTAADAHSDAEDATIFQSARYHNVLSEEIIAIAQNLSDRIGLGATVVSIPNGTAALPSLAFQNSLTTGVYRSAADELSISTAATQRVVVGATGNVGIGIATPDGKFHIHTSTAGVVTANSLANNLVVESGTAMGMSFLTAAAGATRILFGDPDDDDIGIIFYDHSDDSMRFTSGATEAFRILAGQSLFADGTVSLPGVAFISGTAMGIYKSAANELSISTAATQRVVVDASGNVGIGISSVTDPLQVGLGTAGVTLVVSVRHSDNTDAASDSKLLIQTGGASGGDSFVQFANGVVVWDAGLDNADSDTFKISASQWGTEFAITTGGLIGIGITTPDGKLHVHTATAGVVSADADGDEGVFENSGNAGITILSGNANLGSILFGDDGDNNIGFIQYNHSGDSLGIGTNTSTAITIDSGQQVGIGTASPNSTLEVLGSFGFETRAISANATAGDEVVILADATSGNITVTLPAVAGVTHRQYHVKKIDASANTVIVDGNGAEAIDGGTTRTLTLQWESVTIVTDGTKWFIL